MSERTADIAVIGGGIIGLSCAYELARQSHLRVVVFDKNNPASGTTGGSAGVICLHDLGAIYAQLTLLGHARVLELVRDHGLAYHPWGTLFVNYGEGRFPAEADAYHRRFGTQSDSLYQREFLSPEETRKRFPWIRRENLRGATLYPNQGFLDPYELVTLYENLATATGRVTVCRNTPVLQIRTEGERITTLVTRRGAWSVGTVLNAGGPWGAKVAALAGSEVAVTPQRIQVCVATAFDDYSERAPLIPLPEPVEQEGVWCRGEIGGTMLFGQHHDTTKAGFTVDPDFVNRVNDAAYPASVERVVRRYWNLPKGQFLNGWCCVYGTTEDGFPILSRDTKRKNFYHAVGLNGHGMTCHAGIALATAELMLRGGTSLDLRPVTGHAERMDFSVLDVARFGRRELLTFELK
jgi:sarcosine oxidase subunit beta